MIANRINLIRSRNCCCFVKSSISCIGTYNFTSNHGRPFSNKNHLLDDYVVAKRLRFLPILVNLQSVILTGNK